MSRKTVGVVIGRFQTDELHDGHLELVSYVNEQCKNVCILVGTSAEPTLLNPLPFECVEQMLRTSFPNIPYIVQLNDMPGKNNEWSKHIDSLLELLFPTHIPILYGGKDSFAKHYVGKHKPVLTFSTVTDDHSEKPYSATDIRNEIINDPPRGSADFRAGIIYAVGNFYPVE